MITAIKQRIRNFIPASQRQRAKSLSQVVTRVLLAGDRVKCPCCSGSYRKFMDYASAGSNGRNVIRANAQCPGCGALERHRLLALFLEKRTPLFSGASLRVLHVAPEDFLRKKLRSLPGIKYSSADLMDPSVDLRVDIMQTGLPDSSYDAVICNHVLEHVASDRTAMKEIHRLLRTSGWAIMQVPLDPALQNTFEDPNITDPSERVRYFGQEDHVRNFGLDYPDRLIAAGFQVEPCAVPDLVNRAIAEYHGLDWSEVLYFCRKP